MFCICAPTSHPGSFRCRLHRQGSKGPVTQGGAAPSKMTKTEGPSCSSAPQAKNVKVESKNSKANACG
ncbi:hypothetical protein KP509_27G019800 [Ceratopteris richardii]|uniref:Uncharacterized protein n=1 Tax=Ceratopteris richardii TaxID=49495 RepID=A0A8T2RGF7_CERRI|nr:hypothetical protein KP509_27G019800 [Ceratopteris richardii]